MTTKCILASISIVSMAIFCYTQTRIIIFKISHTMFPEHSVGMLSWPAFLYRTALLYCPALVYWTAPGVYCAACPPPVGQFVLLNNRPYQQQAPVVVKVRKKTGRQSDKIIHQTSRKLRNLCTEFGLKCKRVIPRAGQSSDNKRKLLKINGVLR